MNKLTYVFIGILLIIAGIFVMPKNKPFALGQSSLSCLPEKAAVSAGESVKINAIGGNGNYIWSSPELVINNPFGSSFIVNFATPGVKTITVRSGSLQANCFISVAQSQIQPIYPTYPIPSFPSTGGGGARFFH